MEFFDEQSSSAALAYNNFFNQPQNYYPDSLVRPFSLEADPKFVDPPLDFHLQQGSPCINRGNPAFGDAGAAPGDTSDMGAYGGPGAAQIGVSAIRFSNSRFALK